MPTTDDVLTWRGQELHGSDGENLGTIEEIYLDIETGEPAWALVTTGLFSRKRSFVKESPKIDPDGQLLQPEEAMTRSEEELRVGTADREAGRVRLRKYVVEDEVTQTVPVRREEVRVEREPITVANIDAATSGPEISSEEHEVVLRKEQIDVDQDTRRR